MLTKENATRYMTVVGILHKVSVGETTMGSMYSS